MLTVRLYLSRVPVVPYTSGKRETIAKASPQTL